MSYTPEEIRKAAEIIRHFGTPQPGYLDALAARYEREAAESACVDRLTDEPGLNLTTRQARLLVERYPALLEP